MSVTEDPGGAQHQYANTPPPYLELPAFTIRLYAV